MGDKNILLVESRVPIRPKFEVVERKGLGHPDTLADALAEELSRTYSNYTIKKFGAVLHHNFDKLGLLGGKSFVQFGKGYLTKPIRVLLNGRVSTKFGKEKIAINGILENAIRKFFVERFPSIDKERDIEIHYNLSNSSSPGDNGKKGTESNPRKYWFEPRSLKDLPELKRLFANDTSYGCSYAPLSTTESIVLKVEAMLNSEKYKKKRKWLGSDIKIMASRFGNSLDMTMGIPQIANYVPDVESYRDNIELAKTDIKDLIATIDLEMKVSLNVNTRDNLKTNEFYLTAIGSSIETGDEGLVGRGNRPNGLITANRPMSIEGACGKNPVYHVGKLYNIAANRIAQRLHESTNGYVEVFIISQSGRDLTNPWKTFVFGESVRNNKDIIGIVEEELNSMHDIKESLLRGQVQLY